MRGRSSSKQGNSSGAGAMEADNPKAEPHLSGAYIRSLVKQLTSSSRAKDDDEDHPKRRQNAAKHGESGGAADQNSSPENHQAPPPPPPHKKQVRRRLHTSRPYQERLLNMAEARREIVTALKFHRATMKKQLQANEQQQQRQQIEVEEEEAKFKPNFAYPANYSYCNTTFPSHSSWPVESQYSPSPFFDNHQNLNLNLVALPNQALGLNLNLHDFNDFDAALCQNTTNFSPFTTYPSISSSSTSSSGFPLSMDISQQGEPAVVSGVNLDDDVGGNSGSGLYPAMDDEEMAEIRSIGEQHQMEWNDTLNLVTSARWFKFLKAMEIGPDHDDDQVKSDQDDGHYYPFDQVMEFPEWLNGSDNCLHQHLDEQSSDDYFQDPALPCLDIGEIDGMDGEWLA